MLLLPCLLRACELLQARQQLRAVGAGGGVVDDLTTDEPEAERPQRRAASGRRRKGVSHAANRPSSSNT